MTEEQKEILIAKMLDAPDSLSEAEVEMILHDDELRQLQAISYEMEDALTPGPKIDIERELDLWRLRLRKRPSKFRWIMRVAAVFAGVMILSGGVVKLVDFIFSQGEETVTAEVDKSSDPQLIISLPMPTIEDAQIAETKTPPAEKKLSTSSRRIIHKSARKLPAEREEEFDIDEYIRLQQAKVEHELAMQGANYVLEDVGDYMLMYLACLLYTAR
ncbi:MAG: hypothetical protein K2M10_06745, partial [Muribaculaceae bacterium]|nr:hypothetical protein [Muribaculaceae bacterium]